MPNHPLLVILVLTAVAIPARAEIVCAPGDRAALQACLADPDPVKKLASGTFDLEPGPPLTVTVDDGETPLTITAQDPAAPPVIVCQRDEAGGQYSALSITTTSAQPRDVVVENLFLFGCQTAIAVSPGPGGVFGGVTVRENTVRHSAFGISARGFRRATISGNQIRDTTIGVSITGLAVPADADLLSDLHVSQNEIRAPELKSPTLPNIGIVAGNVNGVISENSVRGYDTFTIGAGRGITIGARGTAGSFSLDVLDNDLRDNQVGVATGGPAQPIFASDGSVSWRLLSEAQGRIEGNTIRSSLVHAVTAFRGSRGWTIGPNFIAGTGFVDYFLIGDKAHPVFPVGEGAPSGDILLRLEKGQSHLDYGIGNVIIE
jgi:hypothetical protein